MIDIVIPTHNHIDMTKRCIESIKTKHYYDLIVVDDHSTDGTIEYLREKNALILHAEGQFNFSRNVNWGVQAGSNPYVLICNNDIEFGQGAIDGLVEVLETTDYAMVGPVSNGVMNRDQRVLREHVAPTTRTLNFFCVLINSIVFNNIGYLDDRFSGYGCEDDDFCIRAMKAGYKMAVAPVFVRHDATTSFKELDKKTLFQHNKDLFKEKWNSAPAQDWKKVGLI